MTLHDNLLSTIGETPLVALHKLYPHANVKIYGKLEAFNPGGSIKDRTAFSILSHALASGEIEAGDTVIESSSGNMAIGLAQACLYFGLDLIVVVDPNVNQQTLKILEAYGANISQVEVPDPEGGFLAARLRRVQDLLALLPDSYWPNQYANPFNPAAHYETMREIVEALDGKLDYLLAATSTCGTIMGCARYAEEVGLSTKIVAVDAVGSVIFDSPAAKRLLPGHGAGRPSQLLDKRYIDQVIHISDGECVQGCRRLLHREALLAGGSSGGIVTALGKLLPQIPEGSTCALLICDRGERYLDTIYSDEWVHANLPDVNLDEEFDDRAEEIEEEMREPDLAFPLASMPVYA